MKKRNIILLAISILIIASISFALILGGDPGLEERPKLTEKSVLEFTMRSIDGQDVKLESYRGKVLLLVNVASKCGFTPQYEGLESIYKKYKDQGLVVMGFPANNFFWQEPGTNEEIKTFCTTKYNVTFPMFAKISVKGKKMHPLYQFLTSKETNPEFSGNISWNFNKFLIDRAGKIVDRFGSKEKPEDERVVQAVEKALKQQPPVETAVEPSNP
jgi:glutathione peroxidase